MENFNLNLVPLRRIWKHNTYNRDRQSSDDILRHYWNAFVPALFIKHW